jgi:hypothetical protein
MEPGRSEFRYSVNPSTDRNGAVSIPLVLITGPRLTGLVHSQSGDVSTSLLVAGVFLGALDELFPSLRSVAL